MHCEQVRADRSRHSSIGRDDVLKYLLLGLLAEKPRHGYDLKVVFDDAVGAAWPINIAQIYTALSKLEDDGLVSHTVEPQVNVPSRKVYALTPAGREELDAWLETPVEVAIRVRDELFFKVLLQARVDGRALKGQLARQRGACVKALEVIGVEQETSDVEPEIGLLRDAAAMRLEADVRWLDHCSTVLAPRRRKRR